jgi:hypothetical protein
MSKLPNYVLFADIIMPNELVKAKHIIDLRVKITNEFNLLAPNLRCLSVSCTQLPKLLPTFLA